MEVELFRHPTLPARQAEKRSAFFHQELPGHQQHDRDDAKQWNLRPLSPDSTWRIAP